MTSDIVKPSRPGVAQLARNDLTGKDGAGGLRFATDVLLNFTRQPAESAPAWTRLPPRGRAAVPSHARRLRAATRAARARAASFLPQLCPYVVAGLCIAPAAAGARVFALTLLYMKRRYFLTCFDAADPALMLP